MVDRDLLLRKLADLDLYLAQVSEYRGISVEQYRTDWKIQRIVERTLQMAIEVCVDVANHVIADRGLRVPATYAEAFDVLAEANLLSGAERAAMVRMVGFRNVTGYGVKRRPPRRPARRLPRTAQRSGSRQLHETPLRRPGTAGSGGVTSRVSTGRRGDLGKPPLRSRGRAAGVTPGAAGSGRKVLWTAYVPCHAEGPSAIVGGRLPDHRLPDRRREGRSYDMDTIRVIHDAVGHTLTVWLDDPAKEHICEETRDEVVLMKDVSGRVIGFELLHYQPAHPVASLAVETIVKTQP